MADSVNAAALPPGADLYLAYIDGAYANLAHVRARFPTARIVTCTVLGGDANAAVGDVEKGDMTPSSCVPWVQRQRAKGGWPTIYTPRTEWPSVRDSFRAAGVGEPPYFIADATNVEHLLAGTVATQWGQHTGPNGGVYDISAVAAYWPGVDPPPTVTPPQWGPTITETNMQPINVQISTDGNGNGYTDVPGLDPAKVISVIDNAADPATNGYSPLPRAGRLNINGQTRVVLEGGPPYGRVDIVVWSA